MRRHQRTFCGNPTLRAGIDADEQWQVMLLSLLPDDPRSLVLGDLLQTAYLDQLEQAAHATHREATLAVRLEKLRASFAAAHKKQEAGDSQFKYGGFHDTEQPLGGYISELRGERTMGTKK